MQPKFREVHSIEPFEIRIAILQSVSEWQCDKVDLSRKNANFSTLIGFHGYVLEGSQKAK